MRLALMPAEHLARQLLDSFEGNWNVISVRDCRLLKIWLMSTRWHSVWNVCHTGNKLITFSVANWHCRNWLQAAAVQTQFICHLRNRYETDDYHAWKFATCIWALDLRHSQVVGCVIVHCYGQLRALQYI